MARDWDEFENGPLSAGRDAVYATLNPSCEIVINRYTYNLLGRPEAIKLMYDRKEPSIGIKPTSLLAPNAFPLKPKGNCENHVIRAKPFCTKHNLHVGHTVRFRLTSMEEGVLVLRVAKTIRVVRAKRSKVRK